MKRRPRIYYTDTQKALMWDRWKAGDSLQQIAQLFDRHHPSIEGILSKTGGIRPASRQRSRLALTLAEREEISRSVVAGDSIRSISKKLGRAASRVKRVSVAFDFERPQRVRSGSLQLSNSSSATAELQPISASPASESQHPKNPRNKLRSGHQAPASTTLASTPPCG